MVAAGERPDEAGSVLMSLYGERPLQRKGCQLQAGDPAFGAGFQCGNVFGREVEAHHPIEKLGSFGGREPQVGRPQLGHLPANA